ncbi:conserved membrane hypothetical protein [Bosea sp. 62]|nr:conserved membrane hypothetical protein [Bosea sp. 46]CAD5257336.1 conserved membrane hypothetical protein [Bosea sp. 21B]CAD5283674.1 conserved membrane hypothetical protein [Bosea sp. 7B]VVT52273.1 conserved membrane hypothetical protein [Bosea sp. EC-HK365B]VXB35874.1 conserved membrane hypothetical protein [Bosea sp. 29B]VXB79212.1 conserved membrane hypothetical protein [Bosea sp. 125]VXC60579.1 conserved membrane hypothetical protein [Bosea sp. 62]VXC90145.1 conserved membrane hypot
MEDQVLAARASSSQDQEGRGAVSLPVNGAPFRHVTLVMLAATLPILASGGAFFVDGPNHLFRVTLWEMMLAGDAVAQFFQAGDRLYPNLAIDVFTGALGKVVPPSVALTVFICTAVCAYIAAAVWCRQARGQRSDLSILLIILLAVYSEPLYWGLFNYILGLGVMFVALHRAIEQRKAPSGSFGVCQALILGAMCLISIFPVMLYVCFCLGMFAVTARDDWRARRFADSADLIRSHWPSAVMVAALVLVMEPGQTGTTEWHLATKITGIFSVGKTTNLSLEYGLSALVLGAVGWLAWRRGLNAGRHELAGLLACVLLFLVMPKYLMSVGAADRRLVPAIVTIVAIFLPGPPSQPAGSERAATALLAGIIAVKVGLLFYLWAPLTRLDASYAAIAKEIPANAIVLFAPPVEEARPDAIERAWRFARLASALQPIPAAEAHVFVEHPHLLLRHLAGRNVLPTQVFLNFWAKRAPELPQLPDPATSQTLADVAAELAWLPRGVIVFVVSHIELDDVVVPDLAVRKIIEVGGVRLYSAARIGDLLQWSGG